MASLNYKTSLIDEEKMTLKKMTYKTSSFKQNEKCHNAHVRHFRLALECLGRK